MNKQEKKQLDIALDHITKAREIIETIKDAEQEKYDNLSEGLQASERGQQFESNANTLEEIYYNLESAEGDLADIINS